MQQEQQEKKEKSVDARLADLAREQYGLISRAQALKEGLWNTGIYHRLASGIWLCARPGVYRFAACAVSWHQRLMAACLQIPGAVAYGRSAGWLYGLDGLGRFPPTPLELAVERTRNPRCADVAIYRVRHLRGEWTHRDAIPVTHLPRTLIDLAGLLSQNDAELALDSALRGRPGLRSWLMKTLAKYPPKAPGAAVVMRRLLALRTSPSDSGLEVKFEQLLRVSGLPAPTFRSPVYDDDGRIGSIDYIWEPQRIVLQTHGWQWHGHRQRWQRDVEQRRRLSVDDWKIIEVTRADLEKPGGPQEIIALCDRAFRSRATPGATGADRVQPDW